MSNKTKKKKNPLLGLVAGGCAGFVESSVCHPLDTIKTRMQLRRQSSTLEAVTQRARSSLMEPALRLQHSLAEPLNVIRSSFLEPSHINRPHHPASMGLVATPSTGTGASGDIRVGSGTNSSGTIKFLVGAASPGASEMSGGPTKSPVKHRPTITIKSSEIITKALPTRKMSVGGRGGGMVVSAPMGPFGTARRIIQREGFLALYKGLSAVYTGIVPKMAIRFVSFETYKEALGGFTSLSSSSGVVVFTAGLLSGLTEAIAVVTPAEVCKIRMQSQYHSMIDPSAIHHRKYRNVVQTALLIAREEGLSALYKGVVPTMLRQGVNQAVNFTAYQAIKTKVMNYQGTTELQPWQSLLIGGVSGGMGPLVNNPLDVVKTRMQKQVVEGGRTPKYRNLVQSCHVIAQEEGVLALWKGITPRLLRIVPGQAITFMTYEVVSGFLQKTGLF